MNNPLRRNIIAGGLLALAVTAQGANSLETGRLAQRSAPNDGAAAIVPLAARSIDLGSVAGVAYYTAERDGFHLVATLAAPSELAPPVRFEVVLASGQSVTLSAPRGWGEAAASVEISRTDDLMMVAQRSALGN